MQRPIKAWKNMYYENDISVYAGHFDEYACFEFKDTFFELSEFQTKELILHLQNVVKYKELQKGEKE